MSPPNYSLGKLGLNAAEKQERSKHVLLLHGDAVQFLSKLHQRCRYSVILIAIPEDGYLRL